MLKKTVIGIMLLIVVSVCMLIIAFSIQCVKVSNAATATGGLSVTISPSVPVVTVNSAFVFTANVASGTPPYRYSWTLYDNLKVPVASGTGNPWNCTVPKWAFVGVGNVTVYVTDSQRKIGFTSKLVRILAISVSVSPDPPVVLDVGQSQVFNSLVLGGKTPFFYKWYLDSNPVSGATSATWTYTPSSAGSHTIYLKVTDAASKTATSNTESVTVNAALSASILPNSVVLDVGQSKLFTSTVAGGTSPYSYQWYLDGAVVSGATTATWAYAPSTTGSHTVYVRVTDSASVPVTAQSNTANVVVKTPFFVTISPSSVTLDVGQSQLFSSNVSGGTSPYSCQWYLNGNAVFGATSGSWTFTPVSAGTYTVFLNVTDSLGVKVESGTASVTMNSKLVVPTVTATPATVDQGQSSILSNSTVISTGTSPYVFQWLEKAPSASSYSPISGATSFNYVFSTTTSTNTGLWRFMLRVTDATGAAVNSTVTSVTLHFSVTFVQAGLPTGTLWNATFNGVTGSSTASQIVFTAIAAGSYSWSIGTPISGGIGIRYAASSQYGSMNVSTQTVVSIKFTNQYYLTVDTSPFGVNSPTGQGWYDSGTNVTVSTDQYVDIVSGGSRYRFDSWTVASGTYSDATVVMNSPEMVTANYVKEYNLTFAQSGVGPDFSGNVMIVKGTSHDRNGTSLWADSGDVYNFTYATSPVVNAGEQYALTGVNASSPLTVTGAMTITGSYTTQYLVTYSATGNALPMTVPPDEWVDSGGSAVGVFPLQVTDTGTRCNFVSDNRTAITEPSLIVGTYQTQFQVTFDKTDVGSDFTGTMVTIDSANYSVAGLPVSFWWDNGSSHSFSFASPLVVNASKQYYWISTFGSSRLQSGTLTVTTSGNVVGNYTDQNQVTFDQIGIRSDFSGTVLIVDGIHYNVTELPVSFSWSVYSVHTYAYLSPLIVGSNSKQYVWTGTIGLSFLQDESMNVTAFGSITGIYKTQYYITFSQSGVGSDLTDPITNVSGNDYGRSGRSDWYDSGANIIFSFHSPLVVSANQKQYVLTDVSGNSTASSLTVSTATTVTGTYETQWYITITSAHGSPTASSGWVDDGAAFSVSVIDPDVVLVLENQWNLSGLTVDGVTQTLSNTVNYASTHASHTIVFSWTEQWYLTVDTSPSGVNSPTGQGWYDSGTNVTVSTVQYVNATSGSRYRFGSWTGASGVYSSAWVVMSSAKTTTANYVVQYKLTVVSSHDSPVPSVGDNWYDAGAHVNASVTSPADESGGTRYRCTGYTGSGNVSSGSGTSVGFNITAPSTLTWNWIAQYKLTMTANFGTTSPSVGDNWYDANSVVSINATAPSIVNGERYVWLNWTGSGSGSYSGMTKTSSLTISGSIIEKAFWQHQYQVSFKTSPSGAGTTIPSGTNLWENAGALSIFAKPNSGYTFASWSVNGSITVNNPSSSSAMATISSSGTITAILARARASPSPTSWTIPFNGVPKSSTPKSITFTVPAERHSWNVSTPISCAQYTLQMSRER